MSNEPYSSIRCAIARDKVDKIWRWLFGNGAHGFDKSFEDLRKIVVGDPEDSDDTGLRGEVRKLQKQGKRNTIILGLLIFAPDVIEQASPYLIRIFAAIIAG